MTFSRNKKLTSLLAGAVLAVGMLPAQALAAAPPALYLTPSSVSVQKGATLTVEVREHSGTKAVNAVQADLTYPSDKLNLVRIDGSGSAFEVKAHERGSDGEISIARGTTNKELKGDQLVGKLVFTAKEAGAAKIDFASTSVLLSTESNSSIDAKTSGATITIKAPAAAAPVAAKPDDTGKKQEKPEEKDAVTAPVADEKGGKTEDTTQPESADTAAVPAAGADGLPETGPGMALGALAGMGTLGYGVRNYLRSKKDLHSALKRK